MKEIIYKSLILIFLSFIIIPSVLSAQSGKISVLTVSQSADRGGIGEIFLEIRPGSGLTFIDSFPLTRLDTQISTRFAKEYACALADIDCTSLDFFYVIRAGGSVIAGPSAGAAMTVLTYSTLQDLEIREDTIMTGTISSGGLIGPVGGTEEKLLAAQKAGFSKVLLPVSQYNKSFESHESFKSYESSSFDPNILVIESIPVTDIEEAIWYFTGHDSRPDEKPLEIPIGYTHQMREVMDLLCTRSKQLEDYSNNVSEQTAEWLSLAETASSEERYYSAASYCFTANLDMRRFIIKDDSQQELRRKYRQLEEDIELFDQELPDKFSTLADLEVYMIVRERLLDAHNTLQNIEYSNISSSDLGYAIERYSSAVTWSTFFGAIDSDELIISDDRLMDSCYSKIGEADERINYITYISGLSMTGSRQQLDDAEEYSRQEEWALCLFSASKSKAEAESVLSAVFGDDINESLERKMDKAEQVLSRQAARDNFPILAYSYFEYAQDLKDSYSANLYAEYAIELASLEIFFADRNPRTIYDWTKVLLFGFGAILGLSAGMLICELLRKNKRGNRKSIKKVSCKSKKKI